MFGIEEAHWFYTDHILPLPRNPPFPSLNFKQFLKHLLNACPLLKPIDPESAWNNFMKYKEGVPVAGAILINEKGDKVLLVRGYKSTASWSFPRGKVNEGEDLRHCAVREVKEEIGFNIDPLLAHDGSDPDDRDDYIELFIRNQKIRLYILTGISEDTIFRTQTKQEIGDIKWFSLSSLPNWTGKRKGRHEFQGDVSKGKLIDESETGIRFYGVSPFLPHLKSWLSTNRIPIPSTSVKKGKSRSKPRQFKPSIPLPLQDDYLFSSAYSSPIDPNLLRTPDGHKRILQQYEKAVEIAMQDPKSKDNPPVRLEEAKKFANTKEGNRALTEFFFGRGVGNSFAAFDAGSSFEETTDFNRGTDTEAQLADEETGGEDLESSFVGASARDTEIEEEFDYGTTGEGEMVEGEVDWGDEDEWQHHQQQKRLHEDISKHLLSTIANPSGAKNYSAYASSYAIHSHVLAPKPKPTPTETASILALLSVTSPPPASIRGGEMLGGRGGGKGGGGKFNTSQAEMMTEATVTDVEWNEGEGTSESFYAGSPQQHMISGAVLDIQKKTEGERSSVGSGSKNLNIPYGGASSTSKDGGGRWGGSSNTTSTTRGYEDVSNSPPGKLSDEERKGKQQALLSALENIALGSPTASGSPTSVKSGGGRGGIPSSDRRASGGDPSGLVGNGIPPVLAQLFNHGAGVVTKPRSNSSSNNSPSRERSPGPGVLPPGQKISEQLYQLTSRNSPATRMREMVRDSVRKSSGGNSGKPLDSKEVTQDVMFDSGDVSRSIRVAPSMANTLSSPSTNSLLSQLATQRISPPHNAANKNLNISSFSNIPVPNQLGNTTKGYTNFGADIPASMLPSAFIGGGTQGGLRQVFGPESIESLLHSQGSTQGLYFGGGIGSAGGSGYLDQLNSIQHQIQQQQQHNMLLEQQSRQQQQNLMTSLINNPQPPISITNPDMNLGAVTGSRVSKGKDHQKLLEIFNNFSSSNQSQLTGGGA